MGKDNAAIEFSRTSLLERTWPRLRSLATLYIVALTLPISILGCVALVVLHILRGDRLVALSPHPTSKTRKGYQPTAIVTGAHCHINLPGSHCTACSTACCTSLVDIRVCSCMLCTKHAKARRGSLVKLFYSANIPVQQATALCTAWIIAHGPIYRQHTAHLMGWAVILGIITP